MVKIGSISGSPVNSLSKGAPEITTKNPLPSTDEDKFVNEKPGRLGRCDVAKPPVAPTRVSFVEDDYDTDPKRCKLLNRNGLVAISSAGGLSWPHFDKEQLQAIRKSVESTEGTHYFLAILDETVKVESFKDQRTWYDRILENAPQLINSRSIREAHAHSIEAQLECIDIVIDKL